MSDRQIITVDGRSIAFRQVGWIGHTDCNSAPGKWIYGMDEDPSIIESGFSPLWVEAHNDEVVYSGPRHDQLDEIVEWAREAVKALHAPHTTHDWDGVPERPIERCKRDDCVKAVRLLWPEDD